MFLLLSYDSTLQQGPGDGPTWCPPKHFTRRFHLALTLLPPALPLPATACRCPPAAVGALPAAGDAAPRRWLDFPAPILVLPLLFILLYHGTLRVDVSLVPQQQ